jgi:hypothetical protein
VLIGAQYKTFYLTNPTFNTNEREGVKANGGDFSDHGRGCSIRTLRVGAVVIRRQQNRRDLAPTTRHFPFSHSQKPAQKKVVAQRVAFSQLFKSNSVEQSPLAEADNCSADLEIPCHLLNPKTRYRVRVKPCTCSIELRGKSLHRSPKRLLPFRISHVFPHILFM